PPVSAFWRTRARRSTCWAVAESVTAADGCGRSVGNGGDDYVDCPRESAVSVLPHARQRSAAWRRISDASMVAMFAVRSARLRPDLVARHSVQSGWFRISAVINAARFGITLHAPGGRSALSERHHDGR